MAIKTGSEGPAGLARITSGTDALDTVLCGGIPRGSAVIVAGLPGTGKTVFSQQIVWANAARAERVLYLSTLSEPMVKMLRFSQTFTFFKPGLLNREVLYSDLGSTLKRDGADTFMQELERLIDQHRPEVLVIDSFKALREFFDDPAAFRLFTSNLVLSLSAWEVTGLLVGEYTADDIRSDPEFAVVDGVILLHGTEEGRRQTRLLRIMKMRGTEFFAGDHAFDITESGIVVYPRMDPTVVGEYAIPSGRLSSAIDGLDDMLAGGLVEATSALITGRSGSGKTLTALSFVVEKPGGPQRQPGLIVTLEESPAQLARNFEAFDWRIDAMMADGRLDLMHVSPSEIEIDRHAAEIRQRAEQNGAKTVLIDSISSLEASVGGYEKHQNYLWAITDYFKRVGVTILLTAEPVGMSAEHVSPFADTVILLRMQEAGGETKRVISIPKQRGSRHDLFARELIIAPPRIAVGPAITDLHKEPGRHERQ